MKQRKTIGGLSPDMRSAVAVLGISLGTRSVGMAVLKDGELLDWKVQCFKGPWSRAKCSLITGRVAKLISYYEASAIALKIPQEAKPSGQVRQLYREIEKLTKKKGLLLHAYSLSDLKELLECATKEALIQAMAARFPELMHTYHKAQKCRSSYHTKTFEAVACAEVFSTDFYSHKQENSAAVSNASPDSE